MIRSSLFSAPKRSLQPIVIRFGRLGDMVMLSSVLHVLHLRFRNPCMVLGAGSWNLQLYRGHPDVARVWAFTRHFPFVLSLTWWRVLWAIRRSAPSPIYVFEHQPRQLARIRRMLALSGIDPGRCLFITDSPHEEEGHWIDRLLKLAQRTPDSLRDASYPVPLSVGKPTPRLRVLDSERAEIDAWLQTRGWSGRKLVLIQPGNFRSMSRRRDRWQRLNADDKAWPVESWVSLLNLILLDTPDALLVLCGAPQEAAMLRQIQAAAGSQRVVVADLPLRQLLALCELAHSMISVDTGPAHAAAALGLPLVVMYGAESQARWLPRSPSGSPVIGIGGPPKSTRVDQIPVKDVFNTWCALLTMVKPSEAPASPTLSCEPI